MDNSYIIPWDEGEGARYLVASRCERLEQVEIVQSPWEKERKKETHTDKNANKTEYNHVSLMA